MAQSFAKALDAFTDQFQARAETVLQNATEAMLTDAGVEDAKQLASQVQAGKITNLKVGDADAVLREFGDGRQAPDYRLRSAAQNWDQYINQAVEEL